MSVGFNYIITFNNNRKISDYQKSFNNNYDKHIKFFLPLNFNNKKDYKAYLSVAINDTFPKKIEKIVCYKSETDLNCYEADISELYRNYEMLKKIGLCRFNLDCDDGRSKFISETFRI